MPRRVFGFQLADALDLDAAVLQTHHADALPEFDTVDRGADRPARALRLRVGDELVDDQRDTVVEEGALPELVDVDFQQIARCPPQRGEFSTRALADEERIRFAGFDQIDDLIHQIEGQRAAIGPGGKGLPGRDRLGQPIERLGIDRAIAVVETIGLLNTKGSCTTSPKGVGNMVNSQRGSWSIR